MQSIQFIQISPDQLQNAIIEGVKNQLEDFKKHFEPKTPTEFLTRQEVSKLLKVDLSTVHNWTRKKILSAHQCGGRIYFMRTEVESALVKLNK